MHHDFVRHAAQEANEWLNELGEIVPGCDRHQAYVILRATLHALRDRVGPDSAVHFGAQLPPLIRGIYYEGWHMAGTPTAEKTAESFLYHIDGELVGWPKDDAELAVRGVFTLLWKKLDVGEIGKVMQLMPKDIRQLWQKQAAA